jgi:uncharacterized protein YxeA
MKRNLIFSLLVVFIILTSIIMTSCLIDAPNYCVYCGKKKAYSNSYTQDTYAYSYVSYKCESCGKEHVLIYDK